MDQHGIPLLCELVQAHTRVNMRMMQSRDRRRPITNARHLVMYIAFTQLGYGVSRIGSELRRDHSSVLHAVRKIRATVTPEMWRQIDMIVEEYNRRVGKQ
jgi:chromosomal replication initiation ATPase DnaA